MTDMRLCAQASLMSSPALMLQSRYLRRAAARCGHNVFSVLRPNQRDPFTHHAPPSGLSDACGPLSFVQVHCQKSFSCTPLKSRVQKQSPRQHRSATCFTKRAGAREQPLCKKRRRLRFQTLRPERRWNLPLNFPCISDGNNRENTVVSSATFIHEAIFRLCQLCPN